MRSRWAPMALTR